MSRIFLTIGVLSNLGLAITFWLGLSISDAASLSEEARQQVSVHFLTALATATGAMMVHAVVLTYFMGTGRWIEETCEAYRLGPNGRDENVRLKYKVIPGMMGCILLIIITGAFGAIADPASNRQMPAAPTIHFCLAITTLACNLLVSYGEFVSIERNGKLINAVIDEVHRLRREKGLEN